MVGVSQKGSRQRCLPFFSENETEENGKKGRKRKKKKRKTPEPEIDSQKGKKWKRNKNGRKQKKKKKNGRKTEKIGSDTVPATPFAKSRCGFLRKSAGLCEKLRLPNAWFTRKNSDLSAPNHKSQIASNFEIAEPKSQEFPPNRCLGRLKSHFQIARFVI